MTCGCVKDLGCFAPCQIIDFGFASPCANPIDWYFEIWTNGGFTTKTVQFDPLEQITLPMVYNENGETMIKIKLPIPHQMPGQYYATTPDGACCFVVHGIPASCGTLPTCD